MSGRGHVRERGILLVAGQDHEGGTGGGYIVGNIHGILRGETLRIFIEIDCPYIFTLLSLYPQVSLFGLFPLAPCLLQPLCDF